ncbi:MAG: aminoacyl-tRNA hydrolase [Taibaiella sp.]|nr:aminoacyl-tRNA hydrolase [Taibaiella sp.]
MKFLIAGLGNIGSQYDATRHNIGFDVADTFVIKHGGTFSLSRLSDVAEVKWKGKIFVVIKPTTYMNESGKAVKYWLDKEKIPLENLIIVADDLALPLGTLRLRASGSAGGQNGLKNIELLLMTNAYNRLRFGIGSNFPKGKQVDYVLGKWTSSEISLAKEGILKSVDAIECWATQGIGKAMTEYNK